MEVAMMNALVKTAKARKLKEIRGYYYPTAKNNMVKDFYHLREFKKIKEDQEGNTTWSFKISPNFKPKKIYIKVEE